MDLVQQLFETSVFGEPCADFRQQSLRDIDRAWRAALLRGQVLSGVQGAGVVAVARGATAAVRVATEGGGQHRGRRCQLLQAMLEHALDQRRMLGNAHTASAEDSRSYGVERFSRRTAQ